MSKRKKMSKALVCCVMRQNVTTSNLFCFLFLQIEDANFFVDAAVRATGAGTSCKSPSSVNSGGGGGNATAAVVGGQAPTEVTSDVFVFPNVSVTAAAAEVGHQGVLACIVELTTRKTKNKCRRKRRGCGDCTPIFCKV